MPGGTPSGPAVEPGGSAERRPVSRPPAGDRGRAGARTSAVVLAGLILLAVALRLVPALGDSMWVDEGYTRALAERSFPDMLSRFATESNGISYQLLVWPLRRIGDADVLLRLPSIAAGAAGVLAVFWVGRRLASDVAGLVAAGAFAVVPMAVAHGSEARPYELVAVFAALAVGALVAGAQDGGRRWWLLMVAAVAAVAYANTLSAVLLVPVVVYVAAAVRAPRRPIMAATAAVLVLVVPLAALTVASRSERNPLFWVPPIDLHEVLSADALLGGRIAAPFVVLLVAAGLSLAVRRGGIGWRSPAGIAVAWLVLPVVTLTLLSLVTPLLVARYLICALPGACLLVGIAAEALPRPAAAAGLAVLAALLVAQSVHDWGPQQDVRGAMRHVEASTSGADPILVDSAVALPVAGAYLPRLRGGKGMLAVPEWGDQPLPLDVALLQPPHGFSKVSERPPDTALMRRLLGPTGRAAVVVALSNPARVWRSQGLRWATRHCRLARRDLRGIQVAIVSGCR